jgi:beta-glucosidase
VIHGFRTIFPIPLGQAASWDPEGVQEAARVAALEAASAGINWTFAPMVDIGRDPRWGRVAEGLGEDPWLASVLAAAMVRGFQGDDLAERGAIAACAKHFAGYGAAEAGRDYAPAAIPEGELRDVHLPPFRAAADAGVATFMVAFNDLNGVPATANEFLLRRVLREEWAYDGMVVSDWSSIPELVVHGVAADVADAARAAALAGVDMDMAGDAYAGHLERLVRDGLVPESRLDDLVRNVLRTKLRLGLFEDPYTDPARFPALACEGHLAVAREAAVRSAVLLQNDGVLPLDPARLKRVAVIGPLADDGYEQMGTWVFDGDARLSRTPLPALREALGAGVRVDHVAALATTRSRDRDGFEAAVAAASGADVAILFVGEESILSGEAHSRADIRLPGAQEALIRAVAETGTPVVAVLMTGRPLALGDVAGSLNALLCVWHPGTMGGPAIADLLLGRSAPCGKLPATFPRMTGQVPLYYARKNTGRPATPDRMMLIDDIPPRAAQHSAGNTSFHLDAGAGPLFPFGHGLTYTRFEYDDMVVEPPVLREGGTVSVSAEVRNAGDRAGVEVVQFYVRDLVASVTRPVRELKGFARVMLEPGAQRRVSFTLRTDDLAFHGRDLCRVTEPGWFHAWIGGSSEADLRAEFELVED